MRDLDLTAGNVVETFKPHCDRIEIAGSIRRGKPNPKDIEIVCIPKTSEDGRDLFGESCRVRDPGFVCTVDKFIRKKGNPHEGRYLQLAVLDDDEEEIQIDLFTCQPVNWGVIFAIRTGPAEFSHYCLAKRAHKFGLKIQGGMLTRDGCIVQCPEEKDLFDNLHMPMIRPSDRGEKSVLDKYGHF